MVSEKLNTFLSLRLSLSLSLSLSLTLALSLPFPDDPMQGSLQREFEGPSRMSRTGGRGVHDPQSRTLTKDTRGPANAPPDPRHPLPSCRPRSPEVLHRRSSPGCCPPPCCSPHPAAGSPGCSLSCRLMAVITVTKGITIPFPWPPTLMHSSHHPFRVRLGRSQGTRLRTLSGTVRRPSHTFPARIPPSVRTRP